jgi:potassium/hydrogen antiporter
MSIALTVVAVGFLVFLAHVFAEIFSRKRIPDVLLLIVIGLIIGPLLNVVNIDHFGMIGPVFTTITLVTILFEGGTELRFEALRNSLRGTTLLTNLNFAATMIIVGLMGWLIFDVAPLIAFMMGAIVGGTSSAVVIPLVRQLNMSDKSRTVLILESAFSDVFCIVFALAFIEAIELGSINIGNMVGQIFASFILATIMGLFGAFFWSVVLHRIRNIKNSIFTTPAFVFIIYGISEMMGYSGAIAALAFGIGLANIDYLQSTSISNYFTRKPDSLNDTERILFAEAVFLLKTFFFVYIGISIRLDDWVSILIGFAITTILFGIRIPIVRASMPKDTDKNDLYYMSGMVPKGLAAAVLATIPLQKGIPFGDYIMNITFSVILFSILFTSILIPLLEKSKSVQLFYGNSLNTNLWIRTSINNWQKKRAEKAASASSQSNTNTQELTDTADSEQKSVDKKPHDKV